MNSPVRKKARISTANADDNFDEIRCSTPDDEIVSNASQLTDALMFVNYHVMSYAVSAHTNTLTSSCGLSSSPREFPHGSSNNAKMFWNLCSSPEQQEDDDNVDLPPAIIDQNTKNTSIGINLAHEILQQRQQQKEKRQEASVNIKHSPTRHDFDSKSCYNRFLHENNRQKVDMSTVLKLPQNQNISKSLMSTSMYRGLLATEEINTYLMPEVFISRSFTRA